MPSRLTTLNTRVLTSILLVAIPVLVVGAALVINVGRSRVRDTQGAELAHIAEYTASAIDAYVFRHILDAALLGRVPEIRRAATAGNEQPYDPGRVSELDKQWQAQGAAAARTALLATTASQFLADLVKNDSIYREVLVTDRRGRLVAASNMTSDYFQADEAWWINAFDSGRGRVSVSDVRRDESAHVYAFDIAVPVPGASDGELAGVMKIVADSREMLAGIAGLELGASMEAMLVRPDGSIVFSRHAFTEGDRFFGADLLRERLEEQVSRKEPIGTMTFEARANEGAQRLVAIAPSQLGRSYPELSWMMALSVDRDELAAPFRSLVWYLILVFALTMVAVLGIALWLSVRLAAPSIDPAYDMHLVEHPHIAGMEERELRNR
jgi:Cache domain